MEFPRSRTPGGLRFCEGRSGIDRDRSKELSGGHEGAEPSGGVEPLPGVSVAELAGDRERFLRLRRCAVGSGRSPVSLAVELTVCPGRGTLDPMPKTLSQVAQDAAELAAPERLKLARLMIDLSEMDSAPLDDVQSAWDDEIQRRFQELRSGEVRGVPLEEVQKRIEAGFKS